jgi:hypothetical protein
VPLTGLEELGGLAAETQRFDLVGCQYGYPKEMLISEVMVLKGTSGGNEVGRPGDNIHQIHQIDNEVASSIWQDKKVFADSNDSSRLHQPLEGFVGYCATRGDALNSGQVLRGDGDTPPTGICCCSV